MTDNNLQNVTEIVRFHHDFNLNDAEAETFGVTKRVDGCVRSYHGTGVKSDNEGVWVQEWLSLAHHVAFQNTTIYPSFVAGVASFADTQQIDIRHVQFHPYPAERAFTAPLTEITVVTLRPDSTSADFEAAIQEATADLKDLSYGPILEDAAHRQYIIVNGWQSVETYHAAMSSSTFFKRLSEIAELDTRIFMLTT